MSRVVLATILAIGCSAPAVPASEPIARPDPVAPPEPVAPQPDPSPPAAPPPEPPRALPIATRDNAGGARCTLGDPVSLATVESRAVDVALAFRGPNAGLVVWSIDEDHVRARAVRTGTELGEPIETELGHAHGMDVLSPVGDRYLVVSRGWICGRYGGACFHSRVLDAEGRAAGPVLDETTHDQESVVGHWLAAPDGIVAAEGGRWSSHLARYRVDAQGAIAVEEITRCCAGCSGSGPYRALAADGDGWLVIGWDDECQDGDGWTLWRSSENRVHTIRGLAPSSRTLAAAASGSDAWIVFSPEGSRPRLAHLDANGHLVDRPHTIAEGEALPPPLDQRVDASLAVARGHLVMTRSDPAQRAIGEPLDVAPLSESRNALAVAFTGEDFAIAYGAPQGEHWEIVFRRARCSP